MAIKKDAAKADIGPKRQVKATFAECTAVEPLKCKYHGLKALDKMIGNILASSGHPMPFVTDKHDNEYELRLPGDIDLPMSTFSKISLSLANKGFSIYNKGLTEEGAFKYQIKPVDGKEFVTPEGEAEKEDADTLSASNAPDKKDGSEADESKDDVDNLEAPAKEQPKQEPEDTSMSVNYLDDLLAEIESMGIGKDKNFLGSYSALQQEVNEADEHDGKTINDLIAKAEKLKVDYIKAQAGGDKKKDPFAELENMDVDSILNDSELDTDLMENFDELEEVAEEATEDLEEALLGNSDFDDEIFGEGDKEASQSTTEEDYEKFVGKLIKDPFPPFLKTDAKLLKELVEKGTMNGTAPSKANIEEWEKAYGNGQGPDGAVKDAVNAAFAKLKEDVKEKAETPPPLSLQDIKDLVSFKGVKEEHFEQNDDLAGTYNAIITTGKNPNGYPLTEGQVTWWNDLLDKTKEANPDELPALGVLKRSLEKVGVLSGEQTKKTLTDDDIVEAFNPIYNPEDDGPLEKNTHHKKFYKDVLTNPSGQELVPAQLEWFKKASEKAHAEGINNYAVELLDKMLEEKGMMTKPGELSEMDKEKYYKQWNNLMDTAINGKNLLGTQYWAETISPILDDYNDGLANNDGNAIRKAIGELQAAVNASSDGKAEKPTKESLITEMQSVIDKIHDTGLDLTWDNDKGMALGDKFGDAINANDLDAAAKALADFKAYINKLETGDEETKMEAEQLTADDIKDFFKKCGIKKPSLLEDKNLEATKTALETGKWLGKPLTSGNKKWYKALADKVPDHKVAQAINAMLESGVGDTSAAKPKKFTLKAIKDWLGTYSGTWDLKIPKESKDAKDILEKGEWQGLSISKGEVGEGTIGSLVDKYKECADSPIKDALLTALGKKSPNASSSSSSSSTTSTNGTSTKEALLSALSGGGKSMAVEGMLKPLEHDEAKFPQNVTQKELENAIAHPVKVLSGHGKLSTRLIEIDGKQYVCKSASGTNGSIVRNGFNADMAYRAGGIYAPDAKLYTFGDGKVYKLAEFIKGKTLWDVWSSADEPTRDKIRKDILKGYPLDVLFSNYDVLGTSPEVIDDHPTLTIQGADGKPQKTHVAFDNIIIGDDGHAYRIDNDGAFAMKGNGNPKGANWEWADETDEDGNVVKGPDGKPKKIKVSAIFGKNATVAHEFYDNWEDREWIDDFRTMRRNERCAGIFDRYSTADIFLSAGNIKLDAVVGTLPKGIQDALAKPVFEMKQMTMRALSASLSGIKNDLMLSAALDASYEASKKGFRELCIGDISFSSGGIGAKESDKGDIPPYPVAKPDPPEDPSKKFAAGAMLSNAEYKGTNVSDIILSAAKTINYHAGFQMTDSQGNKLGGGQALPSPDYSPNSSKIAAFKKIDREKLVELAKTSESAKLVLDYYDSVATSIANGYKLPVQEVKQTNISESLPAGFKTKAEIEFEEQKEEVMAKYHLDMKKYQEEILPTYNKNKKEWEDKEKEKLRSGSHGLEGNFYDIANEFMEAAYNTDGVAQHNGESIDFIELGKYQNKYGGEVEGSTTENDSWTPASSHLKVLDLLMSGRTLESIASITDDDPLVNNGHHSGTTAKNWFLGEAQKMLANPEQTRREMLAYSIFKGLQVVKLENESADISLSTGGNVPWIDHGCHTVALIRKESFSNAAPDTIAPIVQKGGNVSCGFQSNGCIGIYPYAYDVPLWNIAYTYSDANHKGSKVESYQGSEHEWVANLVGITPFRVDSSTNASKNVIISRTNAILKKKRDQRIARLSHFFTTMADLQKIVKKDA